MFKKIVILSLMACTLVLATKTTIHNLDKYSFEQYIQEYEKYYESSEDYKLHEQTFYKNLNHIIENNAQPGNTLILGVNKFADLTEEEFKKFKGKLSQYREQSQALFLGKQADADVPKALDWRKTDGVVTAVKNQGSCGSCWAFSTTESIESHWAITNNVKAPVLSPQEIVDCTPNPQQCGGTGGCEGATEQLGFEYAETVGMTLNSDYPYTARDGQCQESSKTAVAKITGYVNVTSNDQNALLEGLQKGPVSVSVAASGFAWQLYFGGVMSSCSKDAVIDHAVQAVGYDMSDPDNMWWIVRNSWGGSWGESGYIRLKMYNTANQKCGTDSSPGDGSGCKGDNTPVPVCGECGVLYDNSYPIAAKQTE